MSLLAVFCFLFVCFLFEKRVVDDLQRVLGDDGTHLIAVDALRRRAHRASRRSKEMLPGRDTIDERSCARDPIYCSIISQVIQRPERNISDVCLLLLCCVVEIATIRAFVIIVVVIEAIILIAMMANDWGRW
jgi:hypothetical protein